MNAIRTFAVAGRSQSLTSAANELNVTQGAVSRMIQALEQDLGVQLFSRVGRTLRLTEAGALYHAEIDASLAIITQANAAVHRRTNPSLQTLPIAVNPTFATYWLLPRMPIFRRALPGIRLEIVGNDRGTPSQLAEAKVIIRYGSPPWPGFTAERLPTGPLAVLCSPKLIKTEPVRSLQDLMSKPLLTHTPSSLDHWTEYFDQHGISSNISINHIRLEQLNMVIEAAAGGMGFALIPLFLVEKHLQSGSLTVALEEKLVSVRGFHMLHEPSADANEQVNQLKAWLVTELHRCGTGDAPPSHRMLVSTMNIVQSDK